MASGTPVKFELMHAFSVPFFKWRSLLICLESLAEGQENRQGRLGNGTHGSKPGSYTPLTLATKDSVWLWLEPVPSKSNNLFWRGMCVFLLL